MDGTAKLDKNHAQRNMSKQENDKRVKDLYMFHAGFHEVHTAAESIGEEDRAQLT